MFKLGQKVVCINDNINSETSSYTPCKPRRGQIYTVRDVLTQPHIEGYGVYLEELLNPSIIWSDGDEKEWPFKSERFRPVEPKKKEFALSSAHPSDTRPERSPTGESNET